MTPRERILAALDHRESDRAPLDLGSSIVTSITRAAYEPLRAHLGLPAEEIVVYDEVQQLPYVGEDVLERFGVDTRMVQLPPTHVQGVEIVDEGEYYAMWDRALRIDLHGVDDVHADLDEVRDELEDCASMDSGALKRAYGDDIVFWGGGVDTQRVLPFGTPQDVRDEVKRRIDDFAPGGGFVFATVHNIQAFVPPENIEAAFDTALVYGAGASAS
jgi:hypothetical protein